LCEEQTTDNMRCFVVVAALGAVSAVAVAPPSHAPVRTSGPGSRPSRVGVAGGVDATAAKASSNRPELINYDPVADPGAVVVDSSGSARFTVMTVRPVPPPPTHQSAPTQPHTVLLVELIAVFRYTSGLCTPHASRPSPPFSPPRAPSGPPHPHGEHCGRPRGSL